ncbi:MAG: DUF4403 family protein [Ghiorsea sp.]
MKLRSKLSLLLIAMLLVMPDFGVRAPMPAPLPATKAPAPVASTFLLAVNVNHKMLYDKLEAAVPLVYSGEGHGTVGKTITTSYDTKYEINRDKIDLTFGENIIAIATYLSGTGNAVVPARMLRPRISVTMDVEADIGIESIVNVKPDWFITSTTTTHLDVTKAATKILKIPVSAIGDVQKALNPKVEDLAKKVTAALDKIDVRTPVEKAWQKLAKPILVDKKKSGWLSIKPSALYYSGFTNTNTGIRAVIGVDAIIDGAYGTKPKDIDVGNLPAFKLVVPTASGFNINLPVFASYDYLRKPLRKKVVGKVFDLDHGAKVVVSDVNLYSNGDKIVVMLDVIAKLPNKWMDVSAKLYFSGKPVFDEKTKRLSMQDFNYDLRTENYLLEVAHDLFHESLRNNIAHKLSWDFSSKLKTAKTRANKNLAKVNLKNGARLLGSVSKVGVNGVYPLANGIQIGAVLKGDVTVEF